MYREVCFSEKNVYKWSKRRFATKKLSSQWEHIDSLVKKFWTQLSSKKVMLTVFYDMKITHQNLPYLLNEP